MNYAIAERAPTRPSFRPMPISAPATERKGIEFLGQAMDRMFVRGRLKGHLLGPGKESTPVPPAVLHLLKEIVQVLARGDSVTIVPVGKELTSQEAANLLNVSRQYMVRLLNEGKLPYRKTGKHRRIRFEDVIRYREERDRGRRGALRKLTQLSEEAGAYEAQRDLVQREKEAEGSEAEVT